jgi:hypothetical protein
MPQAKTVTLNRGHKPIFPDRCAFSGLPCGAQTIGILTRDGLKRRALLAGWYYTRVPCRKELWWRVHLARAWRFCRTAAVGLGSMALTGYLLYPTLKNAALGLSALGVTVLCIIAVVVWEKTHPPPFNITVLGNYVDFEFRDHGYAQEFARLNGMRSEE